jgi:cytochrome c5
MRNKFQARYGSDERTGNGERLGATMKNQKLSLGQRSLLVFTVLLCAFTAGCPKTSSKYPDPKARFANYTQTCDGIPGNLPDHYGYYLTDQQKAGACTWYLWPGGDPLRTQGSPENARGNPRFWRLTEKKLWLTSKLADLPIDVAMLRYVTSTPRGQRFQKLGLINDPGCTAAPKPDPYGLNLDNCTDPYSSGIMGIRIFPNPDFNPAVWDANKFLNYDPRIEPPYLAGLTCGICHISFNPTKPPADPENPQWENLAPAIGNQYIHEGEMFKGRLTQANFVYWVFESQQPGTSDTSRISTDFINNPNAINSIWYILSARPKHAEVMNDGTTQDVPHILKDGSDSIGPAGAALRVYVNIGTCPDYRMSLEDTFMGILRPLPLSSDAKNPTVQHPFDLNNAEKNCVDWQLTSARMANAANFLDANQPYYLKDAPGGTSYMTSTPAVLDLGKTVFGQQCARCHSSKLPPEVTQGLDKHSPQAAAAWVKLVKTSDFLDKNFLSDDDRYPLVSSDPRMAIGTNSNRALGTNPDTGHLWQNFSSVTFKQLPSPGPLVLENPFDAAKKITHQIPQGGGGYYRTPSLINMWATAPYFHNNMLGKFTGDPSVKGRMDAFQDAIEKLLWPEKRTGLATMKVTGTDSVLNVGAIEIRIPAGTPIDLLANINVYAAVQPGQLLEMLKQLNQHPELMVRLVQALKNHGQYDKQLDAFLPLLLAESQSPDFIQDHGHTFGADLPEDQKRALIEYMKTF